MNKVQEALKAAIDELEELQRVFEHDNSNYEIDLCKSALADIEKCEPVGEVYNKDKKYMLLNNSDKEYPHGTLLYTSPISKEWVGLPDTEHSKIIWECTKLNQNLRDDLETFNYVLNATKAIEAKLRELNT
jgi:hypothetical protein